MSSKKARRRERQARKSDNARRGPTPVTLFIVAVGVAVLLTVGASVLLTDRSGQGEPPWPGAVWSAAHDHWH